MNITIFADSANGATQGALRTSLIAGAVGLASALIVATVSGVIAWRIAARNHEWEVAREDKRYEREKEAEQTRWERERKTRYDELRADHYATFVATGQQILYSGSLNHTDKSPEELREWSALLMKFQSDYQVVVIVASDPVRDAGSDYHAKTVEYVELVAKNTDSETIDKARREVVHEAATFISEVRRERG